MMNQQFLPGWLYRDEAIHRLDCTLYANHFWHPVAAAADLRPGQSLAITLLHQPLLLTWPEGEQPRAFRNRCPHRGVAFQADGEAGKPRRRLICPYHGWTYNLQGELLSATRESDFEDGFDRRAWGLHELPCRLDGPLIWVSLNSQAISLDEQLALVHKTSNIPWSAAPTQLRHVQRSLACNWKIAHDNTLDDYHVAIAHPKPSTASKARCANTFIASAATAICWKLPIRMGGGFSHLDYLHGAIYLCGRTDE